MVETRFYTPPGMLRRILFQRDPVITCGGGILRLEGFSACCGVYARLDLHRDAFDADRLEPGTSNVDFHLPMRAALAKLRDGERARLEVSASGFTLDSQSTGPAFERRVELPTRWIKGFVEVQAHQARMKRCFEISGVMGQRFLRDLPRQRTTGPVWVTPLGNSLRLSHGPVPGGILAGGIERLKLLSEVARHATQIEVYASGDGATAWQLETPDARLFLVLSPEPSRGFSGEGQVLRSLAIGSGITQQRAVPSCAGNETLLRAHFPTSLRPAKQMCRPLLPNSARWASSDMTLRRAPTSTVSCHSIYHASQRLHPRLNGARELTRAGAVEMDEGGAWVRGRQADYYVRRDPQGQWRCSCAWASRHGSSRGPCKHVLAAHIAGGV